MPLHLLGKKSWNVYNQDNIERVRKDEAAAALAEEDAEQRMQEIDAARRTAILRGETPPPLPKSPSPVSDQTKRKRDRGVEDAGRPKDWEKEERRKKRRLRGEDDTDRDMRLARADVNAGEKARATLAVGGQGHSKRSQRDEDVSIRDDRGHISLFKPPKEEADAGAEKSSKRATRQTREVEEAKSNVGMQFRHAAGYKNGTGKPWYVAGEDQKSITAATSHARTDVWGNPDPKRAVRDQVRTSVNDPMAFMQKAQSQLRQSERDKRDYDAKQKEEIRKMKKIEDEERRRRRRDKDRDEQRRKPGLRSRHGSVDSLEGFSLDEPPKPRCEGESHERRRRSRHDRSTSRDHSGKHDRRVDRHRH